jgi:ribosome-associated protein
MDGMLQADSEAVFKAAVLLGGLLKDHKAIDMVVLDLRGLNAFTDFFVIGTVTSYTHLQGLERRIKEFSVENNLEILRKSRSAHSVSDSEWRLIDMGTIVVHLMTEKARSFYELERLWSEAKRVDY